MEKEKCKHEGYSGDAWSTRKFRCEFKASTPAGYCKRHDPEIIKAKQDKKRNQWKKERDDIKRKRAIRDYKAGAWDVLLEICRRGVFQDASPSPLQIASDYVDKLKDIEEANDVRD